MKPKHLFNIIKRNNYTFDYDCPIIEEMKERFYET